MAIFDEYEVASWDVDGGGGRVNFPIETLEERYSNRLKPHRRVDQDGARLEDTGGDYTVWTITTSWYNSDLHEDGVDGLAQYPDGVNEMAEACKVHATGTLVLPTVGQRRCRLASYRRVETRQQGVDLAAVVYTFHEDNEDDQKQAFAALPSAASVAQRVVIDAVIITEQNGTNLPDLADINEFAAQLEDLANGPSQFIADVEAKANAIANKIDAVTAAFEDAAREGIEESAALLTDPSSSTPGRLLRIASDVARRSPVAKAATRIVTRTFTGTVSLFDVAADLDQDVDKLMEINSSLPDYLEILPGTPVRVELAA